jgi:hypothetical protein
MDLAGAGFGEGAGVGAADLLRVSLLLGGGLEVCEEEGVRGESLEGRAGEGEGWWAYPGGGRGGGGCGGGRFCGGHWIDWFKNCDGFRGLE